MTFAQVRALGCQQWEPTRWLLRTTHRWPGHHGQDVPVDPSAGTGRQTFYQRVQRHHQLTVHHSKASDLSFYRKEWFYTLQHFINVFLQATRNQAIQLRNMGIPVSFVGIQGHFHSSDINIDVVKVSINLISKHKNLMSHRIKTILEYSFFTVQVRQSGGGGSEDLDNGAYSYRKRRKQESERSEWLVNVVLQSPSGRGRYALGILGRCNTPCSR